MVVGQQSLDIGNVFCYLANVWFGAVTNVTSNALYAAEKERESELCQSFSKCIWEISLWSLKDV